MLMAFQWSEVKSKVPVPSKNLTENQEGQNFHLVQGHPLGVGRRLQLLELPYVSQDNSRSHLQVDRKTQYAVRLDSQSEPSLVFLPTRGGI